MTTYGLKAFRYIELSNVEDSPGSTEAGVELAQGSTITLPLGDYLTRTTFEDEERGYLVSHMSDPVITQQEANLTWEGALNYRQMLWPFAMCICKPSIVAYVWTYEPAWAGPYGNDPSQTDGIETFTINYGDNIQAYETSYCFGRRLSISHTPGDLVRFSCDITGRTVTTDAFDSPAAQTVLYCPKSKFYMSASGMGNIPGSQVFYVKGWTWTLDTAFSPHYTSSGQMYFYDVTEDKKKVELELILARTSAVDGLWDDFVAGTQHSIRIETLTSTGATCFRIDGEYQFMSWDTGEEAGVSTHTVRCESVWDSTTSSSWKIIATSGITTAWPS